MAGARHGAHKVGMSLEVKPDEVKEASARSAGTRPPAFSALRLPVLLLLFTTAAVVESMRLTSLSSLAGADIWWHLRTGLWMAHNHALPRNGIYSQSSELPWFAVNWSYDLLLAGAYRLLGLRALPALLMACKAALAAVTFLLAGGWQGRFWPAVALSALVQYVLGAVPATPVYFSLLLFGVELLLLFESRSGRQVRLLFWLPPLFLVWVNISPDFVYGIAALAIFLSAQVIQERGQIGQGMTMCVAGVLSFIATFLSPYGYHSWGTFLANMVSGANRYFPDYLAMSFHQPQDYLLLLLTMAAFLSLGLRRSRDWFQIALLAGSAALSFHSRRDIWLVCLTASAILGQALSNPAATELTSRLQWRLASLLLAALVLIAAFEFRVPRSNETLLAEVGKSYPVAACNFIRENHLPQPLFNDLQWGGFLTWYQADLPVAIDGRTNLYSDSDYITYSKVMNADLPYVAYPAFAQARTILLPRHSIIAEALSSVPAFKVVYRDNVSTVLGPTSQEQ